MQLTNGQISYMNSLESQAQTNQLLRGKLDKSLGKLQPNCSFFLKISFLGSPRSLLARFRHNCTDYDYQVSKGNDRETEWLRVKNDLLEILSILESFREEILKNQHPTGLQWFTKEVALFEKFDLSKLIADIAKEGINPVKVDKTNYEVELNKSLFIRYITQYYSLGVDQIKAWMKGSADQSQFTVELAQKIIEQWDKYDPETYGDPFELWDFFSTKAEYEFLR